MCEKALTFLALCGVVLLLFGGVAFLAWMDVREHERRMREMGRGRDDDEA